MRLKSLLRAVLAFIVHSVCAVGFAVSSEQEHRAEYSRAIKDHIRTTLIDFESSIRAVSLEWAVDQVFFPNDDRERPGVFHIGENSLVLDRDKWRVSQGMRVWTTPADWRKAGRHLSVRVDSVFDGGKFTRLTDRFGDFKPRYLLSQSEQIEKVVLYHHVDLVFSWCRPTQARPYRKVLSGKSLVGDSITKDGETLLPVTYFHGPTSYQFLLSQNRHFLVHEIEIHNTQGLAHSVRYNYQDLRGVTVPTSWTSRYYEGGRVRRQTRAAVTRVAFDAAAVDAFQLDIPRDIESVPVN